MKIHEATETAYKNGYADGYEDGKRDAVKHGKWKINDELIPWGCPYECSVCGMANCATNKYCPNCGARMDGDGNA